MASAAEVVLGVPLDHRHRMQKLGYGVKNFNAQLSLNFSNALFLVMREVSPNVRLKLFDESFSTSEALTRNFNGKKMKGTVG